MVLPPQGHEKCGYFHHEVMDVKPIGNGRQELITRQAALSNIFRYADIAFGADDDTPKMQKILDPQTRSRQVQTTNDQNDIVHAFTTNVKGKNIRRRRLNYTKRWTMFKTKKSWSKTVGYLHLNLEADAEIEGTFKVSINSWGGIDVIHMKAAGDLKVTVTGTLDAKGSWNDSFTKSVGSKYWVSVRFLHSCDVLLIFLCSSSAQFGSHLQV